MGSTMEGLVAEAVMKVLVKELNKRLKPLEEQLKAIAQKLESAKDNETGEKLITISEAAERLRINENTLNRIIKDGCIATVRTPGGRRKVLESSLNSYLKEMAG